MEENTGLEKVTDSSPKNHLLLLLSRVPAGSALPKEKMSFQPPEDLLCAVCQDIFTNPMVLSCSHSFCKDCLQTWWAGKPSRECPLCNRRSSRSDPPCNLALKNLCTAFLLQKNKASSGSELLCHLHSEKLKLFCLEHQQPVCLVCRDSKKHNNHRFRPADEAARDHREELQKLLRPLQAKLMLFQHAKQNCDLMTKHMKLQAQHTESQIQEEFKVLYHFLRAEEEARITALKEEEEQKMMMMKKHNEALGKAMRTLSDTVSATEEELRADHVRFLLLYSTAVKRIQQHPLLDAPQLPPGALIDVGKHLGNLSFNVWDKMKNVVSHAPVILDPNTANPEFTLSDDLTSVRHGQRQSLPENPERINCHRSVRGCEGISSGRHCWDVDVGDNTAWFVGMTEHVWWNKEKHSRFWQIEFYNNKYSLRTVEHPPIPLRVKKKLQRIRVILDWNRGKLSWFDPDTNTHLHTVTYTFTEELFPCIGTLDELPLKVLESKISVTKE